MNDIVHVLRQYESGWAAGINNSDVKGFFPSCCVVPILPVTVKRQQSVTPMIQSLENQRNFRRDTMGSRSAMSIRYSGRYGSSREYNG